MTPAERAARDRTNAFLQAMHSSADTIVTLKRGDALIPLKGSDLLLLLAALDRHEQVAESALETARQGAEHAERFGPVPQRVEVTYSRVPRDLDPPDGSVWGFPSDGHGLPHEDGE